MKITLWRSVHRKHASAAFSGDGAARYPGRYNVAGQRAVYLADCPAGCALELVANYAAPEALRQQVLFEVEVDAPVVDLRTEKVRRQLGVSVAELIASDNYAAGRRLALRLHRQRTAGAIVPAATVSRAFNVVIYPDVWNAFVVRRSTVLGLDRRVGERLA